MRSRKEWAVRIFIQIIGLFIAHFGVTLFLLSDLGSDPFNVLNQGFYRTLSRIFGWRFLTHGRVFTTVSLILLLILFLTDRHYIKIGAVLCMVLGGQIIDLCTWLLSPFLSDLNMAGRLCLVVSGCLILGFGTTVVLKSGAGSGPNDSLALMLSEKAHRPFSVFRMILDALYVLTGYLLGASVGIGTIVDICLVGPVASLFMPMTDRVVSKIVRRFCGSTSDSQ